MQNKIMSYWFLQAVGNSLKNDDVQCKNQETYCKKQEKTRSHTTSRTVNCLSL